MKNIFILALSFAFLFHHLDVLAAPPAWFKNLQEETPELSVNCDLTGELGKSSTKIEVSNCTVDEKTTTANSVQGLVFNEFIFTFSERTENLEQAMTNFDKKFVTNLTAQLKRFNKEAPLPAGVTIHEMQVTTDKGEALNFAKVDYKGELNKFVGRLTLKLTKVIGQILPITQLDKFVLPQMFNMNHRFKIQESMPQIVSELLSKDFPEYQETLFSPDLAGDYNIVLGGGIGSLLAFDILKQYHQMQTNSGVPKKVIYKLTQIKNVQWIKSMFKDDDNFSHRLSKEKIDLEYEIYGIPNSGFYVIHTLDAETRNQASSYMILMPERSFSVVYRGQNLSVMYSTHTAGDPMVDSEIRIRAELSKDFTAVFKQFEKNGKIQPEGWSSETRVKQRGAQKGANEQEKWGWAYFDSKYETSWALRLVLKAKKLYGLQPVSE